LEILRVENISKIYGKGETAVKALNDVSFSVEKGQFVAIIGPSGSGKSTLLHIIGGVDRPTSGKVYVDNTDIFQLDETKLAIFRRRQIGKTRPKGKDGRIDRRITIIVQNKTAFTVYNVKAFLYSSFPIYDVRLSLSH
jgi:ABC-type oligopeptide transport system ATPase subunit